MRQKLSFTILFCLSALLFLPTVVEAKILQKDVLRQYTLTADKVAVTETITATVVDPEFLVSAGSEEIFVVFNPILDDEEAQSKIDQTTPTIRVTDQAGNPISFTTEVDGQHILIRVKRARNLLYNQPHTIIASYDSHALLTKTGAIYDLYIPSFAEDYQFETENTSLRINSKVVIPESMGDLNFVTPNVLPQLVNNSREITFTQEQLTGTISWIQIGTTQYYSFDIRQPFPRTSGVPIFFNTYSVILPRDITSGDSQQEVFFHEISPEPESISQDENGNLIAHFSLPANDSGEVIIRGYAKVSNLKSVDLSLSGKLEDIPGQLLGANIAPAQYWEVTAPEIAAKAAELKGDETDIYKLITTTYNYVVDQIDYSEVKRFGINERQGALKTLQGGAAVCMEYSDLFISLMRAQGVPARAAFGFGYDSRISGGVDTAHQWAEVYLPTYDSWIAVDTTWGESGSAVIGSNLNHLYKYVANVDPNTPAPITAAYFGNLDAIPEDEFQIIAIEAPPEGEAAETASDLLAKYPASAAGNVLSSLNRSLVNLASFANRQLDNLVAHLGVSNESAGVVKAGIIIVPIVTILTTVILVRRRRSRRGSRMKLSEIG